MRSRIHGSGALAAISCILAIICLDCALLIFQPLPAQRLDSMIYDVWMRNMPAQKPHPAPVIIEIDEKSLEEQGQWPWPRDTLAALVNNLLAAGVAAIGMDMLLKEADRTSPVWLKNRAADLYGVNLDLSALPPYAFDHDDYFASSMAGKPVVVGAFADFNPGAVLPHRLPKAGNIAEKTPRGAPNPRDTIARAGGMLAPLETLSEQIPVGLINTSLESDGAVRGAPLLVRIGDAIYPALSLRTLMAALGKSLRLDSDADGLNALKVGNFRVPVGHDGTFNPVFLGPAGVFPYFSASDVLAGRVNSGNLAGRIAFIGATSIGLGDIRATPFDAATPGVEVHATITDNILNGRSIIMPAWTLGGQILVIAFAALLAGTFFGLLPAWSALLLGSLLLAGCFGASFHLFEKGLFISPLYGALAIVLIGSLFLPWRFWREARSRFQLRKAFSSYVSPKIVKSIINDGLNPLSGEKKEVSILFTDVRGFTTISEQLASNELVSLLNSYFTPMTECVTRREGTLDKFIGDALMAFWNAPLEVKEHQVKAVEAALDMQGRLAALRPEFRRRFGVDLHMGAGIHCGEARVGNMGSTDLLDYTCIGRNVNTASRLEGLCKYYGVNIMVSEPVRHACAERLQFIFIDRVKVKGSDDPLRIYTPQAGEAPDAEILAAWNEGQASYGRGDFSGALSLFERAGDWEPLAKACQVFMERCRRMITEPPEDWTGVWKHDTK